MVKVNSRVDNLIKDILFVDEEKGNILVSLRRIVLKVFPSAQEEIKYGGLVFVINRRLFCGIFIRKKHLSVEFDHGAGIPDPNKFLEGDGKLRRHLKIFNNQDIKNKKVEYFIKQSFNY